MSKFFAITFNPVNKVVVEDACRGSIVLQLKVPHSEMKLDKVENPCKIIFNELNVTKILGCKVTLLGLTFDNNSDILLSED